MTLLRHLILGNPENRRVRAFVEALAARGHPEPIIFAHADLIDHPEALAAVPETPHWVRIDSTGENDVVRRKLLTLGYETAAATDASTIAPCKLSDPIEHGRIIAPRQEHFGFLHYLDTLNVQFGHRPNWKVLSPIPEIKVLFDKRICSARYRNLNIPVPDTLIADSPDALRAAMEQSEIHKVFVKVACASSASCLAIFSHGPECDTILTTVERSRGKMYNSRRLQHTAHRESIDALLAFLLGEGAQIERAEPKAKLDGAFMDCRVLAIGGEPRFTVVRQNRHPITNLHLGGFRGDLEAFHKIVSPLALQAAHESCRTIARSHGCLQVGIDVMYMPGFHEHRILEANAFGDLLPGLECDGLDVYGWQIRQSEQLE